MYLRLCQWNKLTKYTTTKKSVIDKIVTKTNEPAHEIMVLRRPEKAQARMRICAVSPEPPLFAHKSDIYPHWMAAHASLKNDFTEDKNYHNLMTWLNYSIQFHIQMVSTSCSVHALFHLKPFSQT